MLTVSARWAPAITASHAVAHRVEVWRGGTLLVPDLPVSGGVVVRDFGADITLSADIEVADPAYLPVSVDDPLMPVGGEVRVFLGVRYADRTRELVQVFAGPIVSAPTKPTSDGGFTVKCEGWLRYVADDRFLAPYAPTGGTVAAVTGLLTGSVPGAVVRVSPSVTDRPVADAVVFEEDRFKAVAELAAGIGAVVREDPAGGFLVAPDPAPDPAAVPVRSYVYGQGNTMLDRSDPELTRDERYNGVVAYHPDDESVRAVATVDDPASPVRWGGPFGRKVLYYSSPLLTADTVAAAAQTRLRNLQGRIRQIDAEVAPDPSLEPGDHVHIRWPVAYRSKGQVEELAMVRRVEHRIGPGTTKLELRGT